MIIYPAMGNTRVATESDIEIHWFMQQASRHPHIYKPSPIIPSLPQIHGKATV
ncbi:hypothetical protein SAMN06265218_10719 [Fodinibius sediminis]|uniref:Uncharacterized protein n=1 Tax=Fodinibius sediminis TaxID=1214077 RepID=A0A521CQZ5_9BACT|nr:hypothetical protein SAMN06265218_10719 [Fodinibius sediminis]